MSGIAGIFHVTTAKPVDPARVGTMLDALAHRGPDGEGVWTAPGVGLGHRRLIIGNLEGGAQPMASADGRLHVSHDGRIYNLRDVRRRLEALGAVFRTANDAEVILHGWRHWGPECLAQFEGMFAFALHDADRGALFLARDRLGVKPLYYTELGDGAVLFASELKGLLAHPLLRRTPDLSAIDDYLGLGYVPDDACIVAGVKKLPAGHHVLLRRGHPVPAPTCWWDVSFADRATGSATALGDELIEHMRTAVRTRMTADVPVGAFLSDGADSAAVVALMAEASPRAIDTCSIDFGGPGLDDGRAVAERFAARHRSRIADASDFALIDTLAGIYDEPFADAGAFSTYQFCQLARETMTVALSSDGADEAFGGYRRHAFHLHEDRVRRVLPLPFRRMVASLSERLLLRAEAPPTRITFQTLGRSAEDAYARSVSAIGPEMRAALYSENARRMLGRHRAEDRYVRTMRDAPARDTLDRAQYADLKIGLPGHILTRIDRASMAVGLEVRQPLLDHRLIAFAARLPGTMRVRNGAGMWLMKRALRRFLPEAMLYRPKMDVMPPISAWLRGPHAQEVEALPYTSTLATTGWFDTSALARLAAEHRTGRSDHGRLLWQLLMLDRSLVRLFGLGQAGYVASTK